MTGIAGHDPGISGHVRPESLVTLLRNTQLSSDDYAAYCDELFVWAQKVKRSLSESEMNADNFSNWGRGRLEPDKDFKVGWWREQL